MNAGRYIDIDIGIGLKSPISASCSTFFRVSITAFYVSNILCIIGLFDFCILRDLF